jgi:hypothetical protein
MNSINLLTFPNRDQSLFDAHNRNWHIIRSIRIYFGNKNWQAFRQFSQHTNLSDWEAFCRSHKTEANRMFDDNVTSHIMEPLCIAGHLIKPSWNKPTTSWYPLNGGHVITTTTDTFERKTVFLVPSAKALLPVPYELPYRMLTICLKRTRETREGRWRLTSFFCFRNADRWRWCDDSVGCNAMERDERANPLQCIHLDWRWGLATLLF